MLLIENIGNSCYISCALQLIHAVKHGLMKQDVRLTYHEVIEFVKKMNEKNPEFYTRQMGDVFECFCNIMSSSLKDIERRVQFLEYTIVECNSCDYISKRKDVVNAYIFDICHPGNIGDNIIFKTSSHDILHDATCETCGSKGTLTKRFAYDFSETSFVVVVIPRTNMSKNDVVIDTSIKFGIKREYIFECVARVHHQGSCVDGGHYISTFPTLGFGVSDAQKFSIPGCGYNSDICLALYARCDI